MKTRKSLTMLAVAASTLFIFSLSTGCKKENSDSEDFQTTAQDIGQSESIAQDVDNMTAQVSRTGTFSHGSCQNSGYDQFAFNTCATVTNDSINHVVIYDFHTGCTGPDGKTRAGRVIVNYTGAGYFDPGASWVVTFDSFYVNTRHVEGTRSVINNGFNGAGNMTWSITATNMRITRTDGTWRSWNSNRTREMVAGYGDSTWVNDVYLVNGTTTGTNSNGESHSSVLTNLRHENSCHWITSGTMEITPSNKPVRTIDFGNGTCDDIATVTKNGFSKTIHLRP